MNAIEQKRALIAVGGSYLLILLCLYFYFYPPQKLNVLYGYRTPLSMKNQENPNYANKLSSKYMLLNTGIGLIIFLVAFALWWYKLSVDAITLGNMAVLCVSLLALIPMVEVRLREFEKH